MSNQPVDEQFRYKILIVDDVPKNIQVLGSLLFHENYDVSFASNGYDAISLAEQNHIDLILLDVMMPGMDGFETCLLLGKNPKTAGVPVIFMTALNDLEDKVKGFQAGGVDFITKPFESQEVLARVKSQLKIGRLQTELQLKIMELEKRNRFITDVFGTYLSDEVVENLLDNPENIKPGGELREISILMADLRGFSSTAETLNPGLTLQLLNLFIEKMTDVIQKYEGTINEVLGDALLVLFGAPFYKEDHADRAIACAIEMQNQIDPLNELLRVMQLPPVRMGIGINSGEVIVGNIGSKKRLKYGVVGRNVNLTARIESYTVGYQILLSEQTFYSVSGELLVEKVIKVNPKGVKQPVHLFDVRGITGIFNVDLRLPDHSLKLLKDALSISFEVLDDSETIKKEKFGEIINISSYEAELITSEQFRIYSNLKMKLTSKCGNNFVETVHAKVVNKISNGYVIVFTSHFSLLNEFIETCST